MVPIITMPFTVGIILAWYLIVLLMFSASDTSTFSINTVLVPSALITGMNTEYSGASVSSYEKIEYDMDIQNSFFVHLMWMFWGVKFMEYFNFLVVSGCVADWFLDKELVDHPDANEEFKKGNCKRIWSSLYRTI